MPKWVMPSNAEVERVRQIYNDLAAALKPAYADSDPEVQRVLHDHGYGVLSYIIVGFCRRMEKKRLHFDAGMRDTNVLMASRLLARDDRGSKEWWQSLRKWCNSIRIAGRTGMEERVFPFD